MKSDKIERKIDVTSIEILEIYYISDFGEKTDFLIFLKFGVKN